MSKLSSLHTWSASLLYIELHLMGNEWSRIPQCHFQWRYHHIKGNCFQWWSISRLKQEICCPSWIRVIFTILIWIFLKDYSVYLVTNTIWNKNLHSRHCLSKVYLCQNNTTLHINKHLFYDTWSFYSLIYRKLSW